ncbi:MAG: hypothetical protein RSB82_04525 [Victivallaceae bacterium]
MKGKFSFTAFAFMLLALTIGLSSGFASETTEVFYPGEEQIDMEFVDLWDFIYAWFFKKKDREKQREIEEERNRLKEEMRKKEYLLEEEKLKWEKWQWEKRKCEK